MRSLAGHHQLAEKLRLRSFFLSYCRRGPRAFSSSPSSYQEEEGGEDGEPEEEHSHGSRSPASRHGSPSCLLKPPLPDHPSNGDTFLKSPQLSTKVLPVLSSCLPSVPLRPADHAWMDEHLPTVKKALGLGLPDDASTSAATAPPEDSPLFHLDSLLYLAFQHFESERSKKAKSVRLGHSRLWFLGQYIVELALVEYFLQRYPSELCSCLRERIQDLTLMPMLPRYFDRVGLLDVFMKDVVIKKETHLKLIRAVFWSLLAVSYVSMGMKEVYRILFDVFGLNPDDRCCQPKPRLRFKDYDHIACELKKPISWEDAVSMKTADDALFAKPLLYRACVPPGMTRFRGNAWEVNYLSAVQQIIGYPLQTIDEDQSITNARNAELELGLQLCFLHFSMYKEDHPRYCNERLEYLGSKIQDVAMAERLLTKHLDGPGHWMTEKHRKLVLNRVCGLYFREKKLHNYMIYSKDHQALVEVRKRLRNFATVDASQALLGLGYAVYGKAEVRRLMFDFFMYQQTKRSKKLDV